MRSLILALLIGSLATIDSTRASEQTAQAGGPASAPPLDATLAEVQVAAQLRDQLAQDHAKLRAQLEDLRDAIRGQTGWIGVTPEALRQAIEKLQEQQEQLQLD